MIRRRFRHVSIRLLLLALAGAAAFVAGCAPANPEAVEAATAAAEDWLALVDQGKYEESWQEAAQAFRNHVTAEEWTRQIQPIRDPLGDLQSREVSGASYATSLPGAPDGEYVIIRFKTAFANKGTAVETVTPMLDADGTWRVSGYFIK